MKVHVSLNVSNIERSVAFYTKMLGVGPVKLKSDYAKFDLDNPALNLTMNQVEVPAGGSLSHLGIQVASSEEVHAMAKKWQEAGLITLDEEQTDCCYALQDKSWATDPDGNRWEVFVVLGDTSAKDLSTSACCVTPPTLVGIGRN